MFLIFPTDSSRSLSRQRYSGIAAVCRAVCRGFSGFDTNIRNFGRQRAAGIV